VSRRALYAFELAVLLALPHLAVAQQVQLQVPPAPHYAGAPIEIRLAVEGFAEEPQPEVSVATPARGRLEFVGVSPSVSSSITIIDGRVSQSKEVRFIYQYRYLATEPGTVEIGPFSVSQGPLDRTARPVQLEILSVPLSDRLRVELRIPEEPRYVGEHVPVTLEFGLDSELQKNLYSFTLRAPLFDLTDDFQFLEESEPEGDVEVNVETDAGTLRLRGSLSQAVSNGQSFAVVSVTRTLVPLRSGSYEIDPATLVVRERTRWQPDFLGGRQAVPVQKLRAIDRSRVLQVKPVPQQGRPPSFAGAVGRGYTLDVSADRTVVQVGEPIALSFVLRGEGNLESAALPPLDAEGLLTPSDFRVPEGDLAGQYEAGVKRFTAVVRVLDENVREIPALAYSWFDPESERYATTRSRPIALSVRPGEMVAADDVFSPPSEAGEDAPTQERAESGVKPGAPEAALALTGADLAIERNLSVLLRGRREAFGGPWVPVGLYVGASLLVLAALLDRRRRDVDPALAQRRGVLERELQRLRDAAHLPADEAVAEVARALRRMLAEVPAARSDEIEAFLVACDARSYAPAAQRQSAAPDEGFDARALALAKRVSESSR
jgi:hypothetical protein